MADEDGGNEKNLNFFRKKCKTEGSDSEECPEDEEPSFGLDLGLGDNSLNKCSNVGAEGAAAPGVSSFDSGGTGRSGGSTRDDNPFSFSHFLRSSGVGTGGAGECHGGARPKIYPGPTPPSPSLSPSPSRLQMNAPEVASGLPDFVQDHLVIEQCYLNPGHQLSVDLNRLAEFAPLSDCNYGAGGCQDLPFDLTASQHDMSQPKEVGSSTSLPDFLSDGPIRKERGAPPTPSPALSPQRRPSSIENDRLKRELDVLRRQLSDQIVRSETLETELSLLRERDRSGLENIIEQLEENLRKTRKRAEESEVRAAKLKTENNALRCELDTFRSARGGCGRSDVSAASSSALQSDNERLASQLRNAANTAELSLRHLLIGVDNLRLLAASLESHPRRASLSEDSQEEEPGPAL